MNFINKLLEDSKWTFILGTIITTIISYIFYKKSNRERKPCWAIQTNNLIQGFHKIFNDLNIKYKEKEIDTLSISKIGFWNEGKQEIDSSDINLNSNLCIVTNSEGVRILDSKIIKVNGDGDFKALFCENENKVKIKFSYLNKNWGGIIQVIHTGTSSDDLNLIGNIKGSKISKREIEHFISHNETDNKNDTVSIREFINKFFCIVSATFVEFIFVSGFINAIQKYDGSLKSIAIIILLLIPGIGLGYGIFYLISIKKIPKELDIFD